MAIQIRHAFDHGEPDEGAAPDAVIDQMTDLLNLLKCDSVEAASSRSQPAAAGQIGAILFDAGDVLYWRPNAGQRLKKFLKELAIQVETLPVLETEALKHQAFQGWIDQDQYREAVLRMYGVRQPDHLERGKLILNEEDNDVHFFRGVRRTLIALKRRGYLLGVVTDTAHPVSIKLNWFERGGFGHVWDSIISSLELGVRKPDPRIFKAALVQLGVSADQTIFVGHKAEELDGARRAGLKTVAFNYDSQAVADFYIEQFPDLLKLSLIDRPAHPSEKQDP